MEYVIRLTTGDEVVCNTEVLDLTSEDVIIYNPMEVISGREGTMYLRSLLMLSDETFFVIPSSKIVYTYTPSKALIAYYHQACRLFEDKVRPVVEEQIINSTNSIIDQYENNDEVDDTEVTSDAMKTFYEMIKNINKKDLN